jgi:hypothetical protein
MGVHVNDIVGIARTANDGGYFLVGKDGGVFAFGNASFEGSLPGLGNHVNNIIGFAATTTDNGYWVVGSGGHVYAFGDATYFGSAPGAVTSITSNPGGHGCWLTGPDGGVFAFGSATFEGSLPGMGVKVNNIIAMVPSSDGAGYLLIGADGGVFALGDASFEGSLPGIGIHVINIVGAVSTATGLSQRCLLRLHIWPNLLGVGAHGAFIWPAQCLQRILIDSLQSRTVGTSADLFLSMRAWAVHDRIRVGGQVLVLIVPPDGPPCGGQHRIGRV